jgi:hypothetical protein
MAEKVFFDIEARGTSKAIEQIDNLEKALKNVAAAKRKSGANTKKLKALEMQLRAEKKRLNAEVNKSVREFNANKNAVKAAAGSYDQLVERNKALVQQLRRVPDPLGKGKKEFQKLSKEINDNTDKLKKMDKAMGRSHRNVGNYADSLKKGAAVVGKYALAIGAAFMAVKKLFNATKESIDKFDQQVRAEVALEVALGRTSKALLEQASALQQTTRFGDEATIQGQAFLAQMGLEEEAILKLTPAILDMAQAKGMDLKSAFDLVAKSVGSSTNALSRYGIQFDGVAGSTERVDNALAALNEKFSGQAEAATAGAGKLVQLDNAYGDLQETIGGILVNAFEPFIASTHNLVKSFDELLEQKTSEKLREESEEINILVGSITIANKKEEDRLSLISELNKKYPTFLEHINTEKISNEQLVKALNAYNSSMVNKIILQEEDEKIQEKLEKQAEERRNAINKEKEVLKLILEAEESYGFQIDKTGTAQERAAKTIELLKNEHNGLGRALDSSLNLSIKLRNASGKLRNAENTLASATKDTNEAMSNKQQLLEKLGIEQEDNIETTLEQAKVEELTSKEAEKRIQDAYDHFAKIWADREKLKTQGTESTHDGLLAQSKALQEKLEKDKVLLNESNEEFLKEEDARIQAEKALDQQVANQKVALAQQTQDAISGVLFDSVKRRTDAELEALEKQKEQGLISEEAFERKTLEIKRRGFRKLQAIKLAEIASNLASELSAIATNAALNPANAVTAGGAGLAQYGVLQGMAVARAAINAATILAQKFEKGGLVGGGVFEGNSHAQGGVKFSSGGRIMEAEGGEAIINKRSTAMYKPLLSAINQAGGGKKFAFGGITPDAQLQTNAISESGLGAEIARQMGEIRVINVVSDTTSKQISINNVESEALF